MEKEDNERKSRRVIELEFDIIDNNGGKYQFQDLDYFRKIWMIQEIYFCLHDF